ncbi:unnamed protein product, partial [Pylaiella littoralis]
CLPCERSLASSATVNRRPYRGQHKRLGWRCGAFTQVVHTKRGLFPGAKGPRKKPHEPLCKEKQWLFGLGDHTPLVGEWQDFLKNRQHRDGVFLFCASTFVGSSKVFTPKSPTTRLLRRGRIAWET